MNKKMNNFKAKTIEFGKVKNRSISVEFMDAHISSYGGVMLLKEIDKKFGLTKRLSKIIHDPRQEGKIIHDQEKMLAQRIYAIALGEEDVNDHEFLRHDLVIQTAVGGDKTLASPSSISRLENRITMKECFEIGKLNVELISDEFKYSFLRGLPNLVGGIYTNSLSIAN